MRNIITNSQPSSRQTSSSAVHFPRQRSATGVREGFVRNMAFFAACAGSCPAVVPSGVRPSQRVTSGGSPYSDGSHLLAHPDVEVQVVGPTVERVKLQFLRANCGRWLVGGLIPKIHTQTWSFTGTVNGTEPIQVELQSQIANCIQMILPC